MLKKYRDDLEKDAATAKDEKRGEIEELMDMIVRVYAFLCRENEENDIMLV